MRLIITLRFISFIFLVTTSSKFSSVSYPTLLRSFFIAIFAVVPEPKEGVEYCVAFYAEHFDESVSDFVWVSCGSALYLVSVCRVPFSVQIWLNHSSRCGLVKTLSYRVWSLGGNLRKIALPKKQNELAVQRHICVWRQKTRA